MRLFVAVPVSDSVKQYARMIRNELGEARADVKWVEYENYHLTLKFLGEVKESLLPVIIKNLALAADTSPAFHLSAGGLGFFPNRMRPRVIWMGIKGEIEKAEFLGERVDAYLSDLGFEEEKNHRFHLTLGRLRSDSRLPELLKSVAEMGGKEKLRSFKVENFYLMNSSLTPNGPVYSILHTFSLGG
ncbi:MAG: RNA 2',3'-cyclic phosphodiesterase [Syntrophomonas sp.]|nr:RNA 2',3'-cyclic phosphodiesterase [Syntrophomonas sp.]